MGFNINSNRKNIIEKLKEKNFRITKQREILIDIILAGKYSCCKEIFYEASKTDPTIGLATVYRFISMLEDSGVIDTKDRFSVKNCCMEGCGCKKITLEETPLSDSNSDELYCLIDTFLREKGLITNENFSVSIKKE